MTVFSWRGEIDTTMTPLDSVKYSLGFLRSAMMTMENKTGHVKAWVGGPNYKYFMYDMVKLGKRQVGSTVKPFLYTLAMQNGYSPCTMVPNAEQTFYLPDGTTWTAKNSGNTDYDGQMVTLKWGLANSVNQVSGWVMKQFNPESMANMMKKMGITSPIDAVPSMFLGTSDVSIYEMVGAYGTYANRGVYTKPIFVTRIEDKNGNILARFSPDHHDAIDPKTAFLMLNLMEGVVNEGTSQTPSQRWLDLWESYCRYCRENRYYTKINLMAGLWALPLNWLLAFGQVAIYGQYTSRGSPWDREQTWHCLFMAIL